MKEQTKASLLWRLRELRGSSIDDGIQESFRRWRADRGTRSNLNNLLSGAGLTMLLDQVDDGYIVGGQDPMPLRACW